MQRRKEDPNRYATRHDLFATPGCTCGHAKRDSDPSSVVTRLTRSSHILGAEQCIPVDAAIKSITLWATYQHYDEAKLGSIDVGKPADFLVLDKNLRGIPIEELANLKVLHTINERNTICTAQ